ncbi:ComEC/Rec2 family competence protein [Campylobacter cuniculorum]|uniref:ComEC/Rec2 family competence protein n=1 Tax=Campylobacter cuniculorum TaxID=374106 RepID=UPI0023F3FB6A|nr:ComEC/Rec2 family competence protein [Campylobacter cuniculorum]
MTLFRNSFFSQNKEFLFLFAVCLSIFIFNISLEYKNFLEFKQSKHHFIEDAILLQSSTKMNSKNKQYFVLKIKNKEFSFYTTTYKDLNLSKNQHLSLRIITKNLSFKDYLSKKFYVPSYDLKPLQIKAQNAFISYFLNQHKNTKIKEFYGALFFALDISSELRRDINHYGIAHLIAISGYHIGLLFTLTFFILAPLYGFFQKRYFPYRNLKFDLSLIIFILLLVYAYFIGFVPSFTRSLIMAFFGFYLLMKNIKIFSFLTLFISVCIAISLYPKLLFSVGFLFSVLGVFYIFLYIHHFSKYFNTFTNIILLNFWTFFAMTLPVLYFFPLISYQQILGVFLSMIFVFFYPCVLFLHLIGFGGILDEILLIFLNFKLTATEIHLNFWIFLVYILSALLSIRFAILALFCVFSNLIAFIWIAI